MLYKSICIASAIYFSNTKTIIANKTKQIKEKDLTDIPAIYLCRLSKIISPHVLKIKVNAATIAFLFFFKVYFSFQEEQPDFLRKGGLTLNLDYGKLVFQEEIGGCY